MTVGQAMRSARQRAKCPMYRLAAELGVDEVTLWRYERGRLRVPDDVLIHAAAMLRAPEILEAHPAVRAYLEWSGGDAA